MLQSLDRTKSEAYKKLMQDMSMKDQRYMLDFFPPSGDSSLVSVSYTLQVFIAFKGLTMPNKKPLEEIPL